MYECYTNHQEKKRCLIMLHLSGEGKKNGEVGGWLGEQNEKRIVKGMNPFSKEGF